MFTENKLADLIWTKLLKIMLLVERTHSWAQFGGVTGDVYPTFSGGGDIICDVPPLFLFRFCSWRSSKNKSDVCHVLCEVLIMLDVTNSQVDVETEFGVVLLDSVSLSVIASIK